MNEERDNKTGFKQCRTVDHHFLYQDIKESPKHSSFDAPMETSGARGNGHVHQGGMLYHHMT